MSIIKNQRTPIAAAPITSTTVVRIRSKSNYIEVVKRKIHSFLFGLQHNIIWNSKIDFLKVKSVEYVSEKKTYDWPKPDHFGKYATVCISRFPIAKCN